MEFPLYNEKTEVKFKSLPKLPGPERVGHLSGYWKEDKQVLCFQKMEGTSTQVNMRCNGRKKQNLARGEEAPRVPRIKWLRVSGAV